MLLDCGSSEVPHEVPNALHHEVPNALHQVLLGCGPVACLTPPSCAPSPIATRDGALNAYRNQLDAQTGKSVTAADAALLKSLSTALQ